MKGMKSGWLLRFLLRFLLMLSGSKSLLPKRKLFPSLLCCCLSLNKHLELTGFKCFFAPFSKCSRNISEAWAGCYPRCTHGKWAGSSSARLVHLLPRLLVRKLGSRGGGSARPQGWQTFPFSTFGASTVTTATRKIYIRLLFHLKSQNLKKSSSVTIDNTR